MTSTDPLEGRLRGLSLELPEQGPHLDDERGSAVSALHLSLASCAPARNSNTSFEFFTASSRRRAGWTCLGSRTCPVGR